MSCQEFAKIVGELTGEPTARNAALENGLSHAAACERCGARLQLERALTSGLQVLASDESALQAPTTVKRDLMAAFEKRHLQTSAEVIAFPRRPTWTRWALAAAATLILGFTLFAVRQRQTTAPANQEIAHSAQGNIVTPPEKTGPGEAGLSKETQGGVTNKPDTQALSEATPTAEDKQPVTASLASPSRAAAVKSRRTHTLIRPIPAAVTEVAATEVKTDFVPLTYMNDATAMDSGIVVRVLVAREKLAALGLPLNLERADETIKADILLGDDGVARAIRLVQDSH